MWNKNTFICWTISETKWNSKTSVVFVVLSSWISFSLWTSDDSIIEMLKNSSKMCVRPERKEKKKKGKLCLWLPIKLQLKSQCVADTKASMHLQIEWRWCYFDLNVFNFVVVVIFLFLRLEHLSFLWHLSCWWCVRTHWSFCGWVWYKWFEIS